MKSLTKNEMKQVSGGFFPGFYTAVGVAITAILSQEEETTEWAGGQSGGGGSGSSW